MNIGLFTDTYYPELNGVANSVFLLKKELEKKGHNVYVITTKTPGAPAEEEGVYRMPSKSVSFVPERRLGLIYHPAIARKIHQMKLDIIHTNTEFSIGMFGRIMAHEMFIPVVHTYHTIYEDYTHYIKKYISKEERAKKLAKLYSKFSVRGAEELIVPTGKVAELMQRYGVKPDINIIPTGIDLERFGFRDDTAQKDELKAALGIPRENKVVLYLGRVSEEKNIDEVMNYLDRYMESQKKVTFLVVGDGPYLGTLKEKAGELKHHQHMIFAGSKPWDEITHYYQLADVFVSASTSETQGLTYIEALASGIPIVARKDPCLEGVLLHGVNGYAFDDAQTFIYGIDRILWNENQIDYGKNAADSVEQFSTEKFAARVENIYYHAIKTHRNILRRMANKVADRIGYERTGVKPLGGSMAVELGNSDMDASRIALNCMYMSGISVQEADKLLNVALEQGITLFDHADVYGNGKSEEIFGQVLTENKGMRERMRIQTKLGIRDGYCDCSKAYLLTAVDDSLRRLQTDCIDILLLHCPDMLIDVEEVAEAFHQLQKNGKVRQFGVSNFNPMQIELLQTACRELLLVNQIRFGLGYGGMCRNAFTRETDCGRGKIWNMDILDYCRLNGITVQALGPLQCGKDGVSFIDNENYSELNERLEQLAQHYSVTKAAVAAAWILRHPAGIQMMADTMNPEQLKAICDANVVNLNRKEWYELCRAAGYRVL
ncbi:MAG: aldo/keto reductase [Lachnospiraceae bacterium]|nr:aldo/keto reductase [Lachnospiraceae bacterium]